MPSVRFKALRERVEEKRQHLLPSEFEASGLYPEQDRIVHLTLAFRLLCHAEIEAYLEDRVAEIAKEALNAWRNRRYVSIVSFALVAFSGLVMDRAPDTIEAPSPMKDDQWRAQIDLGKRLDKAVSGFIKFVVAQNHGILERNLLAMLLPIGFDYREIDSTFVADMTSFGRARGDAAHQSVAKPHVRQAVDPEQEYNQVVRLLEGLEAVDVGLDRLSDVAKG